MNKDKFNYKSSIACIVERKKLKYILIICVFLNFIKLFNPNISYDKNFIPFLEYFIFLLCVWWKLDSS